MSIGEAWLSLIADFHSHNQPYNQVLWYSWAHTDGSFQSQREGRTSPHFSGLPTPGTDGFYVHEPGGTYWVHYDYPYSRDVSPSQVYLSWVENFYKDRELYDYPTQIDEAWFNKRKYWATRQADVLQGLSQISEVSD